ncbi:MAG: ABC transporter ATP-binding protein/permease [Lachnospiraceae bacterium]|nr:ABC transporter ATP-binding protein/permease [Lachnospiraceae bacterium]
MWSSFRKFQKLFSSRQKRQLVILFFLMLFGAFLEILGVSLIVPLVSVVMREDIMETNPLIGEVCRLLHIQSNRSFLIFCVLFLIFVFIFKDLYLAFEIYVQNRFVYNNRFRMQQRLMDSYLNRGYEYYLNASSGEIVRVVQQDVSNAFYLLSSLLNFTTELVVSLALVAVVFVINPMMTLLVGIILLLTMWIIAKVAKPMLNRQGKILQESAAQTNKWLLQMVNGMKEILVGDKKGFFLENFSRDGRKMVRAERWNILLQNIPRLLIEMSSIVSMLLALLVAVLMGVEVSTLVPTIAAFAMAALKLMPSANRISTALNGVAYYEPSLDKLLKNLSLAGEEKTAQGVHIPVGDTSSPVQGNGKKIVAEKTFSLGREVKVCDVSYHYPEAEQPVLQEADMIIPVGKSVGIVGASGAGKTTVVDIILGLLNPQSGEVFADDVPVREHYAEWLSHIGYIPQMIFMLDDTIRANVAFGIAAAFVNEAQVWKALEEAQLADFVKALPEGLDTVIGERGIRLSGGQRQRIGIARALYPNPELLFFDEATSALDTETESAIMESINRLHGKKTLVIIAHRLATIAECDIVYRVGEGKIVRER